MRGIRAAALAGALLVAAGCTPVPPLSERLQPWVGRSEFDLIAAFGVPSGTYEVDGVKFIQFRSQSTVYSPGDYPFYRPYGRFGPIWGPAAFPPTVWVIGCEVTFALRRGVVESFSFRGSGCR